MNYYFYTCIKVSVDSNGVEILMLGLFFIILPLDIRSHIYASHTTPNNIKVK